MSTNQDGSRNIVVVTSEETPSFLKDEIQLKKILKQLDKSALEAVETLTKLLESQDEKVRLQAASKLLEFKITVSDKINQDKMQRLIAEIKIGKGPQSKLIPLNDPEDVPGGNKPRPIVDFSTVRSIE